MLYFIFFAFPPTSTTQPVNCLCSRLGGQLSDTAAEGAPCVEVRAWSSMSSRCHICGSVIMAGGHVTLHQSRDIGVGFRNEC